MDPLNDPRFPKRPATQDFARLQEIVMQMDGRAVEGKIPPPVQVGDLIDLKSLEYLRDNRLMMLLREAGLPAQLLPALQAVYLDAWTTGYLFHERGGHRD